MSDRRTVVREFDAKAAFYESNRLAPWYKGHAEKILDRLALKPGELVLDVGCGTGYLLREIVRRFPGVEGAGLDLTPAMIEQARSKAASAGLPNLRFACADWEDAGFEVSALTGDRRPSCVVCANAALFFVAASGLSQDVERAPAGRSSVGA